MYENIHPSKTVFQCVCFTFVTVVGFVCWGWGYVRQSRDLPISGEVIQQLVGSRFRWFIDSMNNQSINRSETIQ